MTGPTPALPLLRWTNAVATLHTHPLVGDAAGQPFLTAVASLLWQLAALAWQVLGSLVTAAQGTSAARVATDQIDPLYGRLGRFLLGAGGASLVLVVVVAGAVLAVGRAARRGEGLTGALRGLAGVLVPVAALVVTVHAAATPGGRGSPSWAVSRLSGWTTALSGSVTALGQGPAVPPAVPGPQETAGPGCGAYLTALDRQYASQATQPGSGPGPWQGGDALLLSHLWEATVMGPWERAQFGPGPLGAKTFCHLLEIQAGVPTSDQLHTMAAAPSGPAGGPSWAQLVGTAGSGQAAGVLGPQFAGGDDDLRRTMVAWAACDWEGPAAGAGTQGWVVDPAFTHVDPAPQPQSCQAWWGQGTTTPPAAGAGPAGPFDFEDQHTLVTATAGAPEARAYVDALDGQDPGAALSTSVVSLVSSAAFAATLGGLALGVLVGKLCLILLVACLPLVLLLAAVPTATTRAAARRAAGLTGAALASTVLFSTLLSVELLLTGALQSASAQVLAPAGDLAPLTEALVPLAAAFVLRRLLRLADLEAVTTVRGVVRTTATLGRMGATAGLAPTSVELAPAAWSPAVARGVSAGGAVAGRHQGPVLPAGWSSYHHGPAPPLRWPAPTGPEAAVPLGELGQGRTALPPGPPVRALPPPPP